MGNVGANSKALHSKPEVLAGKTGAGMVINKHTAKSVLSELVKRPCSENTYSARLECLKADRSIPTWQALTRHPEMLKELEQTDLPKLEACLMEAGTWLPEVEAINANVMMNLMVKLAAEYEVSFRSLMLEEGIVEKKDVSIVRGAPGAGKTSYLSGGFSLGTDEVRNYLQDRMPGITMSQLYLHAYTLLDSFLSCMESMFSQSLTRDSLYLYSGVIESKLQLVELQNGMQKAAVHDIQVDLATLCCRMLKRSTSEALMNFDLLSQYFRSSLERRQETIELVQEKPEIISEYSLSIWDGSKSVKVAERSADSLDIIIHDQALFDQQVSRAPVLIDAEIARVRETVIDEAFISSFTAGFEPAIATVFKDALSKYSGKTMAEALELHRDRDHVATSVASRVLADVVPS
jgi:predicted nucleic acid-binding protein